MPLPRSWDLEKMSMPPSSSLATTATAAEDNHVPKPPTKEPNPSFDAADDDPPASCVSSFVAHQVKDCVARPSLSVFAAAGPQSPTATASYVTGGDKTAKTSDATSSEPTDAPVMAQIEDESHLVLSVQEPTVSPFILLEELHYSERSVEALATGAPQGQDVDMENVEEEEFEGKSSCLQNHDAPTEVEVEVEIKDPVSIVKEKMEPDEESASTPTKPTLEMKEVDGAISVAASLVIEKQNKVTQDNIAYPPFNPSPEAFAVEVAAASLLSTKVGSSLLEKPIPPLHLGDNIHLDAPFGNKEPPTSLFLENSSTSTSGVSNIEGINEDSGRTISDTTLALDIKTEAVAPFATGGEVARRPTLNRAYVAPSVKTASSVNVTAALVGPALMAPIAISLSSPTEHADGLVIRTPQGSFKGPLGTYLPSGLGNNNVLHPSGRELKVEDALLYLDQVKLEFGDRPRIYNEFLEIMKNFKAQEVDTIGVINRVRSLFHGYNNLILGFNTFLPEGYKIEMRDLEPVFVGPGLTGTSHTPGYTGPGSSVGVGCVMPQGRGCLSHPVGGRGIGHPQAYARVGGAGRGMTGMLGGRVSGGRGQPLGGRVMPIRGGPPQLCGPGRGPITSIRGGLHHSQGPQLQQQVMRQAQATQQKQAQIQQEQQQLSMVIDSNQNNATRTIEFDHAIMYVTNIKKRFANQPRIYHTFLEILHTYQKEQRGIKEVLEQVSSLFADHPDLLREFTFFLPDAVQEQAKERLSRAAAEAEAKQHAAAIVAAKQLQAHQGAAIEKVKMKGAPTGWRTVSIKGGRPGDGPMLPGTQKFIDMTQPDTGLESHRRTTVSGTVTQQITQQDAFVYNAGVERQFFDLVKASLTSFSRDGQAYAEFIKTLDMYSQEILSRNDMMGYVERLLGKRKDLIEEFKRIINAVGSPDAPTHDDSWHSVPLSEIDFSRCRRCSPSYRALPRDYPNPPCSERSNMEKSVLNDVWVSLPMGSEESNNFRHMRKNQYEETLFRCEDMRFEIDMCIDSNASTLQRLTKIFDELRFLSKTEISHAKSIISLGAGLGGKVYQYTLDGRVLGVIHKHVIRRIYGDDGHEILELCVKNPSVALPIVVNRLRQKNEEFCAARSILNKKWKDIAEYNYYISLDHRSITWRTTDKRATSTRTIVSEIKERAAHNGLEGESATGVRMEKAKEEHGIFYEVTMGSAISRKMDLTGLPLPTKTIFTPHLSLIFDSSGWAQHDAYRIISFAMERSSINPGDKERCNRLWREIIGPWFGLRLSWMQSPAAMFTASLEELDREEDSHSTSTDKDEKNSVYEEKYMNSSGGEEDIADNGRKGLLDNTMLSEEISNPNFTSTMCYGANSSYFSTTNHIPYPPETYVSTVLGEAKIIQYQDSAYKVSVTEQDGSTRTTCLGVNAVYGSIFPVDSSPLTEQLCANDKEELERPEDHLIIGTQCLYLFFRLHQILLMRLTIAKKLATEVSNDPALGKHIEKLAFDGDPNEGLKRYESFLGLVYALIDAGNGSSEASEGGKYEDRVRHLLGNNAYELTTIDKLIAHILKNLQNMANDEILQNMIEIYHRHESIGKFKPSAFRDEAALMSEGENMYAFQICEVPSTDKQIVHFEFLGCIAEDDEEEDDVVQENEDSMLCEF